MIWGSESHCLSLEIWQGNVFYWIQMFGDELGRRFPIMSVCLSVSVSFFFRILQETYSMQNSNTQLLNSYTVHRLQWFCKVGHLLLAQDQHSCQTTIFLTLCYTLPKPNTIRKWQVEQMLFKPSSPTLQNITMVITHVFQYNYLYIHKIRSIINTHCKI